MERNIDDNLLIRYLLDEAEPVDRVTVEHWIAESSANEKRYRQYKQIWETSKELASKSTIDEHAAWLRFQHRLENQVGTGKSKQNTTRLSTWLKIAAAVLLVGVGFWLSYSIYLQKHAIYLESADLVQTDTLRDGSVITLNKNTKIEYPARFARKHRSVKLIKGEAFFDIAHNPSRPFIVYINDVKVRVVGTSFNIKKTDGRTQLIVESGIVEVSQDDVIIRLKKNEMIDMNPSTHQFDRKKVHDKLYQYYRNKVFVADNTPLYRLVAVLNEAYDANIVIQGYELEKLELNTTFKDTSLDSIINIICETFQLKAKKEEGKIILYR